MDRDKKLQEIAQGCLDIPAEYWQSKNLLLKAKELPLVDIMQALQLAYEAGKEST